MKTYLLLRLSLTAPAPREPLQSRVGQSIRSEQCQCLPSGPLSCPLDLLLLGRRLSHPRGARETKPVRAARECRTINIRRLSSHLGRPELRPRRPGERADSAPYRAHRRAGRLTNGTWPLRSAPISRPLIMSAHSADLERPLWGTHKRNPPVRPNIVKRPLDGRRAGHYKSSSAPAGLTIQFE